MRNRSSSSEQGGSAHKTFPHNDAHEITSASGDDYDYDDQGNLLSIENGLSFTYNDRNQTTEIQGPGTGGPLEMTYAGPGQSDRLSAADTDYTANALGIGYQTDGTDRYDFTRDDTGNPVGLRDGSDSYYLITDSIGSVVAVSDEDGDLAATYRYDPYGKITSGGPGGSPAVDNPYTFAGYLRDDLTGLYKAGERYYDPGSGTWTQKDPLSQIQSPNEANPYVYAGADPINNTDPRGYSILGDAWDVANEVYDSSSYFLYETVDRVQFGLYCADYIGSMWSGIPPLDPWGSCDPLGSYLGIEPAW